PAARPSSPAPEMPDLSFERGFEGPVAGVDEAGRGPWAGPVVAAAVVLEAARIPRRLLARIDDSKRLSRPVREEIYAALSALAGGAVAIGVGASAAREIDRLNIHRATLLAMGRAVTALPIRPRVALIDGRFAPEIPCPAQTIIDGDQLSLSIAAASIIAKVTRDRIMAKLALRHPGFGWDHNAGYGTPEHREALNALGPTRHHRRSFAPVLNILSPA
ncbi:MAG: ribonuclease HII, partial [Alphaproteobacteria bacterium]